MKINFGKCKNLVLSVDNILIQEEHAKNVSNFVYHGRSIPNVNKDIERITDLALSFFGRLQKSIQSNKQTSILPIATYASETWVLTAADEKKLFVFKIQCPRSLFGVSKLNRIRKIEIRRPTTSVETIVDVIQEKRLKRFLHVCRKPINTLVYQAYKQDFPHLKLRGRS